LRKLRQENGKTGTACYFARSRREKYGDFEIPCSGDKTVRKHHGKIVKKLEIRNTGQLAKFVYANNLVD